MPVSALTGENVERLREVLLTHLPEGEPLYPEDYLTDQPERFFVAELVREQVLRQTHDELPFSTAVVVDKFEESPTMLTLYCTILVEKASQKPIIIGKGGAAIKAIGTAAREELERFFQTQGVPRSPREGARATGARTSARWTNSGSKAGESGVEPNSRVLHLLGLSWSRRAAVMSSSIQSSGCCASARRPIC